MSWNLDCVWCDWYIVVFPRGMSANDEGSGVQAAVEMEEHVKAVHQRTWREFLMAEKVQGKP